MTEDLSLEDFTTGLAGEPPTPVFHPVWLQRWELPDIVWNVFSWRNWTLLSFLLLPCRFQLQLELFCLGNTLHATFLQVFSHASLHGEKSPAPTTLESFLSEMVANVVPQKAGCLEIFPTLRAAIAERLLFVLLSVVTLQILQLEIADIRASLAAENLAGLQLVDRMVALDMFGQLSHQGETDPAESADRDSLRNLLELEALLIDGKLVLELHDVAVLQNVVLVELVLRHE